MAIDTVPIFKQPEKRIRVVMEAVVPAINQIVTDVVLVAIGTWPTPEDPRK